MATYEYPPQFTHTARAQVEGAIADREVDPGRMPAFVVAAVVDIVAIFATELAGSIATSRESRQWTSTEVREALETFTAWLINRAYQRWYLPSHIRDGYMKIRLYPEGATDFQTRVLHEVGQEPQWRRLHHRIARLAATERKRKAMPLAGVPALMVESGWRSPTLRGRAVSLRQQLEIGSTDTRSRVREI